MPTLSCCMITKDPGDFIVTAVNSVLSYVDEIVIVDSSEVPLTFHNPKIKVIRADHKTHPDAFMWDEGTKQHFMYDEALLRNMSFEHATGDYKMWLDADDTVVNAHYLPNILDVMQNYSVDRAWLAYQYRFYEDGSVAEISKRERIIKSGVGAWRWNAHSVHEAVGCKDEMYNGIWVKHHKDSREFRLGLPGDRPKHRGYKVLTEVNMGRALDPREVFMLAVECVVAAQEEKDWKAGLIDEAKRMFSLHISTCQDRPEERVVSRNALGRLHEDEKQYEDALRLYASAMVDQPLWPESYFNAARICYHKGWWKQCCDITEAGFALNASNGGFIRDVLVRTWRPYFGYIAALANLGRTKDAFEACKKALAIKHHPDLEHNLKVFTDAFSSAKALASMSLPTDEP